MKKFALILLAVLALTLSACTRAASTVPLATPTPDANFPLPVATTNMNAIELAGTQTAIATSAGSMPLPSAEVTGEEGHSPEAGSTEVAVLNPTFTPLPEMNSTPIVATPLPSVTPQSQAASTAVSKTSVPVSNPGTYTLQDGEFPYCLARRFNVDPGALLTLNGLNASQSYYAPGTKITIPQSGGAFPGVRSLKAHPTSYVVRSGDTIYSVACGFGDVDPMAIASANNLSGSYALTAGATIQIP